MSQANLARLRRNALLDDDQIAGIAVTVSHPGMSAASGKSKSSSNANASMLTSSVAIAQQEREFQRAVQPSSPISVLLGAARQPLVMSAAGSGPTGREREQPLIRKLQAAAKEGKSPARPVSTISLASSAAGRAHGNAGGLQDIEEEDNVPETKEHEQVRRKELEAQKARIVAQMVPGPLASAQTTNSKRLYITE